jgi:hypothetical protein
VFAKRKRSCHLFFSENDFTCCATRRRYHVKHLISIVKRKSEIRSGSMTAALAMDRF